MKKSVIFVMFLFFFVLFSTHVYAAEDQLLLAPSTKNVKSGDTITVKLNINCATNFEGLTGILQYSKTKLSLDTENILDGQSMKNMNDQDANGNYVITIFPNNNTENITSATCQTLSFKVLNGVTEGEEIEILLKNVSLKDGDTKIEDLSANTKLTVVSQSTSGSNAGDTVNPNNSSNSNSNNNLNTNQQNVSNSDKNNTGNDKSQADKSVNYTGTKSYSVIIGIVSLIGIVSFVKYRQYKNI